MPLNTNPRFIIALIGLMLALYWLAGCAGNPIEKRKELKNCDFKIKDIQMEKAGAEGIVLKIQLKIYNPNNIEVILDKMDVDVWIDNAATARVTHAEKTSIESKTSQIILLDVTLKTIETYKTIKKLMNKETVVYQLKGKGYFHTIFGDITFPFATEPETIQGKK